MENLQNTRESEKDYVINIPSIDKEGQASSSRLDSQDLKGKKPLNASSKSLSSQHLSSVSNTKSLSDLELSDREARRSRNRLDPIKKQQPGDLSVSIKKSNIDGDMNPEIQGDRPTSSKSVLERLKDNIAASKSSKSGKITAGMSDTKIEMNSRAANVSREGVPTVVDIDISNPQSKKPADTETQAAAISAQQPYESASVQESGAESSTDLIAKPKKSSKKKKKSSSAIQSATDTENVEIRKKKKRSIRSPEYYAALEQQLGELAMDDTPLRTTPGPENTPVTPLKVSSKSPKPESPRKTPKTTTKSPDKSDGKPEEIPILFAHLHKTIQDFKDMIISIHIHKSDSLDSNLYLQHPLVKISLVDQDTGMYLSKSSKSRKVTYAHDPDTISYIMPVLTKPYSLVDNQTKAPIWDEFVVLNELYTHILKPKTLLFLEIVDFVTNIKALEVYPDGWNKIAWGFLRLIGSDGRATTESKARLQLYKYPSVLPKPPMGIPQVYYCWKRRWEKYPSTLYIKVSAHEQLEMTKVTSRPFLPTHIESSKVPWDILLGKNASRQASTKVLDEYLSTTTKPKWRRGVGETCKLPNKLLYRIDTGQKGSFSCAFSNSGLHLAVATVNSTSYPIKVYQIETGERFATLEGHLDLVYQLTWSVDDSSLISASSDGSVRIWSFIGTSCRQTRQLLHPSFVYTAIYQPKLQDPRVIVSGAFDGSIRFWNVLNEMKTFQTSTPDKKIDAHKSNINTLCFNADGTRLFSGDGLGLVKIWSCDEGSVECIKTIDSLHGHPIQALRLHPSNRKLMVQTLGPSLHMLDIRIFRLLTHFELPERRTEMSKYSASLLPETKLPPPLKKLNSIHQISTARFLKSTISPCGTFVLVGSTQGTVHFWRAESGVYLGSYNSLLLSSWTEGNNPIVDITFHPHDHLIAFSVWGEREPLRMYTWDEDSPSIRMATKGASSLTMDGLLKA